MQCRSALRRSASYGGHPSHASLHFACFCKQKKSTDSKTGLPSGAKAMEGMIFPAKQFLCLFKARKKPLEKRLGKSWWRKRDSNPRPSHCQCDALAN